MIEIGYDKQISNYTEHKRATVGEEIYKYGMERLEKTKLGVLVWIHHCYRWMDIQSYRRLCIYTWYIHRLPSSKETLKKQ